MCGRLYQDTDRDIHNTIMVAGTARSGTTWLARTIASQLSCRLMFEPFHSGKVETFQAFDYFPYMRPWEQNEALWAYCRKVFTGDIRHSWIDRQVEHIFPRCRLVKEIRANLFLGWLHNKFPEVPLLFVLRHPCAVVLSRMQLDWWTDKDIESFLSQPKLVHDFLDGKMEVIKGAKTVEEKHAIIWSISNLVPLRHFQSSRLKVVFYEDLCLQPEKEIPRVFEAIGHSYHRSVFEKLGEPSATATSSSAVIAGEDRVNRWKEALSSEQIRNILSVVEAFELDRIYSERATPISRDLRSVFASQCGAESHSCPVLKGRARPA